MDKTLNNMDIQNRMTKILTGLTLAATLLTANSNTFEYFNDDNQKDKIYFSHGDLNTQVIGDYVRITDDWSNVSAEIGEPELPAYTTLFQVDPAKHYTFSYTVLRSHVEKDINLYPYQGLSEQSPLDKPFEKDTQIYTSETIYPEDNLTISDRMTMRDVQLVQVSVVPYQYLPKSRKLTVFDEVEINIEEVGERNATEYLPPLRSKSFEKLYGSMIVNYTPSERGDEYQQPAVLYICGGNSEGHPYFQQLVQWRHERGYVVYTASTSETGSSTTSIKNYIQNAYMNYDPPPEFVGLVGDANGTYTVSTFYDTWSGYNGEGDHPYSQLNGTDLFPEIFIGRLSIRNTTELMTVVNKIIHYEKATYLDETAAYYERASLLGDPSSSGVSTIITNEYVEEVMLAHGMEDVQTNYGNGGYASWMQNQLQEGVLYFNYRGYLGVSGFDDSNIDAANNGYKLPFATIPTCGTGSFANDVTALSEKFFRAGTPTNPKGGVACVGTATWGTHTLFNNIVDMGMYDGIFSRNVGTAGAALASGKLALFTTYPTNPNQWVSTFTHWHNLMGDPSTHLWTDTPTIIQAIHQDTILFGTNYIEIFVQNTDGFSVKDAFVTVLMGDDEIFASQFTNEEGLASFLFDYENTGDITVTVTKDNCKPYLGTVAIVTADKLVNLEDDDLIYITDGNDNIANPGETIEVFIPLKNFGVQAVSGIQAVLSSSSSLVTISSSMVDYDALDVGESSFGSGFNVSISEEAVDHEPLELHLTITDDSGMEWESEIPLDVSGAFLASVGNVELPSGETSDFAVSLINLGALSISGITAELLYEGNLLDIVDAVAEWDEIQPGETVESFDGFTVNVNSDIINGSVISIDLHVQSEGGYDCTIPYQITVGFVTVTDPLGPDNYGYYIYDSGDMGYNLAPVYDWIEITPSNGGLGTSLGLSDNGDGNYSNSIAYVDLPTPFRFYGEDYSEITICTNGWIAFGHSEMESFRNYPIPGAGGPTNMVAAFWDDLKTTGGGNVYTYYNTVEDYLVIEWYQMKTQNNNHTETFQMILYPQPVSPYGDGEIKIQYHTFNNTSSGSYGGYPPLHGGYCTIGIENATADDGLEYTFTDRYPGSAMELEDETAIYITTRMPVFMPIPELAYNQEAINFSLVLDDSSTEYLDISNAGAENSILYYTVSKSYIADLQSPFENPGGGPDNFGYYWADSDIDGTVWYSWTDIEGIGTELSFPSNDLAGDPIDIGFAFPFYGDNYTQCIINPNGWIGFGADNSDWTNNSIPGSDSPNPAIFGFWSDLKPENTGSTNSVYVHSNSERLVVWFNDVIHFPGNNNGTYDFQMILFADGEIKVNYREVSGDINIATVGIQNAYGSDGLQVAYNSDYVHNNLTLAFKVAEPEVDWLTITSENGELNGELSNGEFTQFSVMANSTGLESGSYEATINISTNSSQFAVHIPVSLYVMNQMSLDVLNLPGWNLVGLPLDVTNPSVADVYPVSIENTLYSFNGGYQIESELTTGAGYWLRFNEEASTTIVGQVNNSVTVHLLEDWNLITGVGAAIPVNAIQDTDDIIVPNTIYGYSGGYENAEILNPGAGYWMRAYAEGDIVISTEESGLQRRQTFTNHLYKANSLTFTTSSGKSSSLYFGVDIPKKEQLRYSLPPKPPVGAFDVRFSGDWRFAEESGEILIMNPGKTMTVEYAILDEENWVLIDENGNENTLSGHGTISVTADITIMELQKSASATLPTEFALKQNYPNPFNPTTTISFSIPVANVSRRSDGTSLQIYDLTGRLVKTLLNDKLEPGYHSVVWNGKDAHGQPVASGMYLYQLKTDTFMKTKKLVLLK
ncbi:MAG: T9SS type A sorting domain-containing protein [Candidatus Marinimicrobia bacterium]|nr:T9SS type A sorting domain-containing protein [Candidatus Neomarinimicrobiota bacterium]